MELCDFEYADQAVGRAVEASDVSPDRPTLLLRCRRCGQTLLSPSPPAKTRAACRSILRSPPPRPADAPCIHRGLQLRTEPCQVGCGEGVRIKVFGCALHGECSLAGISADQEGRGVKLCAACPDHAWPAKLSACARCDQFTVGRPAEASNIVAGRCTMTGQAVASMSACPRRLWDQPATPMPSVVDVARWANGPRSHVLIVFPHGFGDHVQLTTVLLHLRRHRPWLLIDVACRTGCEALFRDLCHRVYRIGGELPTGYDLITNLLFRPAGARSAGAWPEPYSAYADSPATKAEQCLRDLFHLAPDAELCRYTCTTTAADQAAAADYLRRIDARAVLIHYQGRCGRELKDIPERAVAGLAAAIRRAGFTPLILDWDANSALVATGNVINVGGDRDLWPEGGEAGRLAALASQSRLCIGIDSGPGHLFGAIKTPTLIVWRKLHPINYYGLADNVTHLVPRNHGAYIRGSRQTGESYFAAHYRHVVYDDLESTLIAAATAILEA